MPAKLDQKEVARRAFARAAAAVTRAQEACWRAGHAMSAAQEELSKVSFCSDAERIGTFLKAEVKLQYEASWALYDSASRVDAQAGNLAEMLGLRR